MEVVGFSMLIKRDEYLVLGLGEGWTLRLVKYEMGQNQPRVSKEWDIFHFKV